MKKIMFNDKFGLTEVVLSGRKTQTRRICKEQVWAFSDIVNAENGIFHFEIPKYEVGEVVAIAQSYKDVGYSPDKVLYRSVPAVDGYKKELASEQKGWTNKMFVAANLMPHHIRITDVKVERLQDISDEDCFKEGVRVLDLDPMNPLCDLYDFPNHDECFGTPQNAYASVIDRIYGGGTWDSNPYVFVFDFELVK